MNYSLEPFLREVVAGGDGLEVTPPGVRVQEEFQPHVEADQDQPARLQQHLHHPHCQGKTPCNTEDVPGPARAPMRGTSRPGRSTTTAAPPNQVSWNTFARQPRSSPSTTGLAGAELKREEYVSHRKSNISGISHLAATSPHKSK